MLVGFLVKVGEDNKTIAIWCRSREGFHDGGFDDGSEVETVVFNDIDFVWASDNKMVGVWIPGKVGGLEGVGLVFKFLDESKRVFTKRFNLSGILVG